MKNIRIAIVLLLLFVLSNKLYAQNVEILPDKTADCPPFTVAFNTRLDPGYTSLEWDFGIGAKVTGNPTPSRIFPDPGVYHVTLTADYSGKKIVKTVDITVYNRPTVSFEVDKNAGCKPLTVNFTDRSTPGDGTIESIIWNFGDGSADQGPGVKHEFTDPGAYNVISLVTNSKGCRSSSEPVNIVVKEAPVLSFTADKTQSCVAPLTVTFQNTSTNTTGDPITYVWDYGDGTTGTEPAHTYTTEGSYAVTLIPTSTNSCAAPLVKKDYVVIKKLTPGFELKEGCAGNQATVVSTSIPKPDFITWTLPDGSFGNGQSASFWAGAAGDYTVKMRATIGTCSQDIEQTVHINPRPVINPVGTPTSSCAPPLTVTFKAQSQNATAWEWDFGDETPKSTEENPTHTYTSKGTFTVTLKASSGSNCTATVSKSEYVIIKPPVLTIYPSGGSGCIPLEIPFSAGITGGDIVSYEWNFGDGTTSTDPKPTHIFDKQGIYTVTLTVKTASGCTVTAQTVFRTGTIPVVDFVATPLTSCAADPIQFTNLSTPTGPDVTYNWIFPQDNTSSTEKDPRHLFSQIGMHDVRLMVNNNGCIRDLLKRQYIKILPPQAEFTTIVDCDNYYHRKFTDKSDFGPEPVPQKEWLWDFGEGGATSTEQNPDFTYKTTGSKTVKLTVYNGACKSTFTYNLNIIDEKPVVLPQTPWVCVGKALAIKFGTLIAGNINSYTIDWGDGTSSWYWGYELDPTKSVSHTYRQSGVYPIQLTIEDKNNCRRVSEAVKIAVHGAVTDFTVSGKKCKNEELTFTDKSTIDAGNKIVNWAWDFDDGSPVQNSATQPLNTKHTYVNFKVYMVALTATDQYGCMVQAQRTVNIETVKADFASPAITCKNSTIAFNDRSSGTVVDYAWDFGDNTTAAGYNPTKSYTTFGTYDISLKITTREGCTDQVTKPKAVRVPNPVADFSFPPNLELCPPVTVPFTNKSSDFVKSLWEFGDNSTSSKNDPGNHIYVRAKTYNVKLTVYSEGDCPSSKTIPVTIEGPDGSFTATPVQGCVPLAVNMTAVANKTTNFQWDFDDGTVLKTQAPVAPAHTYTKAGIYTPRVSLIDDKGCAVKADGNDKIVVDNAVADFTADISAACGGGTVLFKNTSTSVTNDLLGLPYSSKWTYTPPNTSTGTNGSFTYPQPGTYSVTLEITSNYGCKDQKTLPVVVPTQPQATVTPIPPFCIEGTIQLRGSETKNLPGTKWKWQVGNTQEFDVPAPPAFTFNTVGTTPVKLTITNADGTCPATATTNIVVHPAPGLRPTPAEATICKGIGQQLYANTDFNATVSWTPYNISDATSKNPVVKPDKDMIYNVQATSEFGCKSNSSVKVSVIQPFRIYALDASICLGQSVQMQSGGALRYNWSPSSGLDRTDIPDPIAKPAATTTYQVVGYDNAGCFTDTAKATVTVRPTPQINLGPDMEIASGSVVPIPAVGSSDIVKVSWTPITYLSCFDCLAPVATPKGDMTYHVTVVNQYGCLATDDIHIKTVCNGGNVFIPNTFSPNGDGTNDIFYIRGRGMQTVRVFRVYNRWGQLMFERFGINADDPSFGWDGRYKGAPLNPDVYVYYAEVICDSGESIIMKGNVTLIR
ncbi:PKD domain-containing protein [Chitinophaga qingshengii]|uniref:PKD domain-containing protein n=1 Tax=Chitinophaga qingshengii TaxID=1569794 RepID=A0ABR7TJN0_9BACT|nr:PKD domain-containing protein [Chitinophaga qingshengii]MBC9930697.1 PKD domain-containing protein [Chitinophaga qingshengii]